ncbi:MAG: beta-xylosidase [Clostridiales bacterium 43-6]|nr:MAG: beta-xylosidase [Clostridiales bacterium 43-6]
MNQIPERSFFLNTIFFNAHHSPIGSFSTLTLGYRGASGGMAIGLSQPADKSFYLGMQNSDESYTAFPFFETGEDERLRYDAEHFEADHSEGIRTYKEINRTFRLCTDTWIAGNMEAVIYSQVESIGDPAVTPREEMKKVLVPGVLMELTVDNTGCDKSRRAFLGYEGVDSYFSLTGVTEEHHRLTGIAQGGRIGIYTDDDSVLPGAGFSAEQILSETDYDNLVNAGGNTALLLMEVLPNTKKTYRFALCFYHEGRATTGMDTKYYYTTLFEDITEVAAYSLRHFDEYKARCLNSNVLQGGSLSPDQSFMLAHAIRSYYGSTQFLIAGDEPVWVVNEGEYRMMNTLDLTADHLFYELRLNPWTVKNTLQWYLDRYSYTDTVRFPGEEQEYPGGLTFAHDMGVANVFAAGGHSSYEKAGLTGCFSYMSHEQLVNWLLCALAYGTHTGDTDWLMKHADTLEQCLFSMINRDHPEEGRRNGIMGLDTVRTKGGAEITTYDSLDISLGQARNNLYLAGKSWAAYVGLAEFFAALGKTELSDKAEKQALLCAKTICSAYHDEGYLPAVMENGNRSKIIPAIEGLVFPFVMGHRESVSEEGPYGFYIKTLKRHFLNVLKKGECLFENGGWKISSTSNNSWLSKIYLCQFVAREILGIHTCGTKEEADKIHAAWLLDSENAYWCFSDQMISGKAAASKYYPRGVTGILWTLEN